MVFVPSLVHLAPAVGAAPKTEIEEVKSETKNITTRRTARDLWRIYPPLLAK